MSAFPAQTLSRSQPQLSILALDHSSLVGDIGYSTRERLQPLAEALEGATRFRDACRRLHERAAAKDPQSGVPELFSFDKNWQTRLDALRPKAPSYLTSHGLTASRQSPEDAQDWESIDSLIADAMPMLLGSVEARRVARVIPGLIASAASLAKDHEGAKKLHQLLQVADDLAFTVRHPATRREWRIFASGIETNYQLQVLLVDSLISENELPRYDPRVVAAYRGLPISDEPLIASVRFGMYSVGALRPDGTLPRNLSGSKYWIWGEHSPANHSGLPGRTSDLSGRTALSNGMGCGTALCNSTQRTGTGRKRHHDADGSVKKSQRRLRSIQTGVGDASRALFHDRAGFPKFFFR